MGQNGDISKALCGCANKKYYNPITINLLGALLPPPPLWVGCGGGGSRGEVGVAKRCHPRPPPSELFSIHTLFLYLLDSKFLT